MANHKRKRPKNRRAGCLLCKYWKINGSRIRDRDKFSDYKKRYFASKEIVEQFNSLQGTG